MRHLPIVLATVLALGACTDDAEPRFADPTSSAELATPTTPPSTSTPTETPSTLKPRPLSPEQTVRAWVKAFNTASATGETKGIRSLSTRSCTQCNQLVNGLAQIYAEGGTITGGEWTVEKVRRKPDFDTSRGVAVLIDSKGSTLRPGDGRPTQSQPAEKLIMDWTLADDDGTWLVSELAFLS